MYIPRCLYIPNQRSASRKRGAEASQSRLFQASAFRQGLLTEETDLRIRRVHRDGLPRRDAGHVHHGAFADAHAFARVHGVLRLRELRTVGKLDLAVGHSGLALCVVLVGLERIALVPVGEKGTVAREFHVAHGDVERRLGLRFFRQARIVDLDDA